MESFARILDDLPHGRPTDRGFAREPVAIAVGETELKLLEIVLQPGVHPPLGSRVALLPSEGTAPIIDHVRRRLAFDELTPTARVELGPALEEIVRGNPTRYLRFFNEAEAVSRRFHLLELLPGIGKKTMQSILEERKRGPFSSFEDLDRRVRLKHSEKLVVGRIAQELNGVEDKYRLFVAP